MTALPCLRTRLARLVAIRERAEPWPVPEAPAWITTWVRLLDRCIVATMGDLEDAGLSGVEIGRIVKDARAEAGRR